jgi:prepilin-type N-terminal cleavage/methylation domain-containing protein
MRENQSNGFTIIELLIVVSIIALLIGILLPAIGKARDDARVKASMSNLRQLGVAHKAYAADWADRHVTYVRDNLGLYAGDVVRYNEEIYGPGSDRYKVHPGMIAGWGYEDSGVYRMWGYWTTEDNRAMFQPINFPGPPFDHATIDGFGWFRFGVQAKSFSKYLNGRYHDPVYFAPKDRTILEPLEPCFELPGEFAGGRSQGGIGPDICNPAWSSYCLSPAGLFNPMVFSRNRVTGAYWNAPWAMPSGYKVPSFGQVKYPTLKTHMLEHHWLQDPEVPCNDAFLGDCEPYYFNHGYHSVPVTLFYDGSVRLMSVIEAMSSDRRHEFQTGYGLWSRNTPFQTDGFFISDGYDNAAETSFHILTTDGVRGRDTLGRE